MGCVSRFLGEKKNLINVTNQCDMWLTCDLITYGCLGLELWMSVSYSTLLSYEEADTWFISECNKVVHVKLLVRNGPNGSLCCMLIKKIPYFDCMLSLQNQSAFTVLPTNSSLTCFFPLTISELFPSWLFYNPCMSITIFKANFIIQIFAN